MKNCQKFLETQKLYENGKTMKMLIAINTIEVVYPLDEGIHSRILLYDGESMDITTSFDGICLKLENAEMLI